MPILRCLRTGWGSALRFVGGFFGGVSRLGSLGSVRVGGRLEAGIDPALSLGSATSSFLGGFHPSGESLYLTSGVDDSLLTGVERVAHAAKVGAQILPGGPSLERVATRTDYGCFGVIWVYALLHGWIVLH
jgi:hypothetical protein